jgi:hypothetical protein
MWHAEGETRMYATSWDDFFNAYRQDLFPRMISLPRPIEATRHYLEKLEPSILNFFPPGYDMSAILTLPYGIVLGDVVVQRFGAKWQYGDFTPGIIDEKEIYAHEVRLEGKHGIAFRGRPMLRVRKFVRDPGANLTSWYDVFESVANGTFDVERLTKEGLTETSPESVAVYKGDCDQKGEKET